MAKVFRVTQEGLLDLKQELETLKTEGRTDVAEKIRIARGFGDLSENSEYDEAKNEQAKIEARILDLEAMLKNVEIIDEVEEDSDVVVMGVSVKVLDMEFDEESEYRVVGSTEANPRIGKISDESPVGKALLGKSVGDEVIVEAPGGEFKLKVIEITK